VARFDRDELALLTREHDPPCVSVFLPTHRTRPAVEQDPIRLKNLLREAEHRLVATGQRAPEARALLAPAHKLLADELFWEHQGDGLAVFVAPGTFRTYRLPLAVPELVVVSGRFHVKPLLPLLLGDGRFHVLALSQNAARLLECTREGAREVAVDGMPRGIDEALDLDRPQPALQFHTGTPGGGGGERAAMFHGQGGPGEQAKERLLQYCRVIDGHLRRVLGNERTPLVFAGVEYLFPIYRHASSHPHLAAEAVPGNPEGRPAAALAEQAWAIVRPHFERVQQEAVEQYHELAPRGRTSTDVRAVVPAAHEGRVATLFVAIGVQQWGRFDAAARAVSVHDEPAPGDEDLLDLAAVHTMLNGGTAYAVAPDRVPDGGPIAAAFRY
jgi:hypothetical protein